MAARTLLLTAIVSSAVANVAASISLRGNTTALVMRSNATAPMTQKVTVEGTEVYGSGSGHGLINKCTAFSVEVVNSHRSPHLEVCGTGTKVTVYLRNRCEGYYQYTHEIGVCDSKKPSNTCDSASPETQKWLRAAQSYKITDC